MVTLKELTFVIVYLVHMQIAAALWIEFEFVGTENSKTGILRTDFRVTRKNKTVFSLQGAFEFTEDLNDNFDCEGKLFYSSKGNNQYVLTPYKTARASCCKHFETIYWTTVQKEFEKISDLPERNAKERLCFSYKKGHYTLRGFEFDKRVLPKHFNPGSYKLELIMYEKSSDDVSSKFSPIVRLY